MQKKVLLVLTENPPLAGKCRLSAALFSARRCVWFGCLGVWVTSAEGKGSWGGGALLVFSVSPPVFFHHSPRLPPGVFSPLSAARAPDLAESSG